jgi:transposase
MSLRLLGLGPVPEETARTVRAAHRKGHAYIAFADEFAELFEVGDFSELYSTLGQSAVHPVRLAMATLLQFANGFSDRQAVEAISDSLLWKYVLRLELGHPGWDASVLSEFRQRLMEGGCESLLFDKLLHVAEEKGLLKHSHQRTDSTHVLSVAKTLNRLELVHEAMRNCLEELVDDAPDFVQAVLLVDWRDRYYTMRPFNYKLPNTDAARAELAATVGSDIKYLLGGIDASPNGRLQELRSVQILCRIFQEQYKDDDDDDAGPSFRSKEELAASGQMLATPHDTDARFGAKRGEKWLGYKVHLTETFDEGAPHLITNVETTQAHINDSEVLPVIHASLRTRGLKPSVHLVDSGYVQVDELERSLNVHEIDVLTRLTNGHSWQSKSGKGFDLDHFVVDWEGHHVTCPAGIKSDSWKAGKDGDHRVINVSFPSAECSVCPFKEDCTKSESRKLHLKTERVYAFMQNHKERQRTEDFKRAYSKRAGIEGTISQGVHQANMRQSRFVGLQKTHLEKLLQAAGLNLLRIGQWLMDPNLATTRTGRFERLAQGCA